MKRRHFMQMSGMAALLPWVPGQARALVSREQALLVCEAGAPAFLKAPFVQQGVCLTELDQDYSALFDLFGQHRRIHGLTKAGGHFVAEQLAQSRRMQPLFAARHTHTEGVWRHEGRGLKPAGHPTKDDFIWYSWGYEEQA